VTPAEKDRDAAELARAAIERLRAKSENTSRPQEAARTLAPPQVQESRAVAVTPVQPLPPPINVSTVPVDPAVAGVPAPNPPYTASVSADDPNRPIPPADIPSPPVQPPLDLRADVAAAPNPRDHTRNVAEDMLSAAKSMFHAVIPSPGTQKFTE
jgi:hypothetical protein